MDDASTAPQARNAWSRIATKHSCGVSREDGRIVKAVEIDNGHDEQSLLQRQDIKSR
jgi:hypothetical protein